MSPTSRSAQPGAEGRSADASAQEPVITGDVREQKNAPAQENQMTTPQNNQGLPGQQGSRGVESDRGAEKTLPVWPD